ncbi:MAG TPA: hypothetical protein VFT29_10175 [Gemmatimonadaceae bacterium]|nr:hypothetical protein [Gemmatimonadaceae bacterium]
MKRAFAAALVCLLAACRDSLAPTSPTLVAASGRPALVVTPAGVSYTAIDLGTLGGPVAQLIAINAAGQIAGTAQFDGLHARAAFVDGGVLHDLGTLGGTISQATALNTSGIVTGWSRMADGTHHGFVWNGGAMIDLGTLDGDVESFGQAINDNGVVVGSSYTTGFAHGTPFSWKDGVMTPMGTLGGSDSWPWAVNDNGVAAGFSYNVSEEQRPVIWQNGVPTDLGTFGGEFSEALDINDAGQVIGFSFTPNFEAHGFIWENGTLTDLGSLGGYGVIPTEINEHGDVVGSSLLANGSALHGFFWHEGVMQDIGTLPGFQNSVAYGINDNGQVVGYAFNNDVGPVRAFLWENGVMTDLGTLVNGNSASVDGPKSINNRGQIIGSGSTGVPGEVHPILWQPSDPVINVTIDIRPGTAPNEISLSSNGVIPVAILSTAGFDATTVDVATVRFGPGGAVESHGFGHMLDVNGDGITDLMLHFRTQDSGLACGATSAGIAGRTSSGRQIQGSDGIVTTSCQ